MKKTMAGALPLPAQKALLKLGDDLRDARRRRRISTSVMAERAFVSRATLLKMEKGHPAVAIGTYAAVLFVLGMTDRLADIADARFDRLGLSLDEERLPQRIRAKKRL